jgi:hypothetical protein
MEIIPGEKVGGGESLHCKTLESGDITIDIAKGHWYPRREQGKPLPTQQLFPAYSAHIRICQRFWWLYFKPCDDFDTKSDDELLRLILSHITLTPSLVGSLIKDGKAQGRKQAAAALQVLLDGDEV